MSHEDEGVDDMSRLTGKIALVTGASKGIGAGIAKNLGAEGATVAVNSRCHSERKHFKA
jgi:NAD(P)-dependent dehydrogenase (short-subunit alcohol dehydrogenase family)